MKDSEKKEILSWLENPERTAREGKMLYAEFGRNININRRIRVISDDRAIGILETQFKKLLGMSILPEQMDIKRKPKDKAKTKENKTDLGKVAYIIPKRRTLADPYPKDNRPEELKEFYNEKEKLYIEAKNLNSMLVAKGDEMEKLKENSKAYKKLVEERREIAKQVIEKYSQINACWKQIDYFAANGKLPDPEILEEEPEIKADPEDPLEMAKRYRTLSSYISKAKKNPERNQEKLKELYAESNAIARKLNVIYGEEKFKLKGNETPVETDKGTTIESK